MEERNLTSKEYKELVLSGMSTLSEKQTVGLCGRIIRGKEPKDFELLSDEPGKKLSWLVGHDGLHGLSGKQGWSMLRELGKDKGTHSTLFNHGLTRFSPFLYASSLLSSSTSFILSESSEPTTVYVVSRKF
jgi:hypothetical protein